MNLLASANYDPAGAVSKSTASLLAMTALDTANLRLAVTVPAHGKVLFRLKCTVEGATTFPRILLGVMVGAAITGRQSPMGSLDGTALGTTEAAQWAEFIATGLTPGATNFDAAYGVEFAVGSTNIKYGGPDDNTQDNAWGGFVFEAWDPQPIPTAAPGAVGGLLTAPTTANTGLADVTRLLGTAVSAPATAGILDVNIKKIDNVTVNGVGSAGNPWGP